MSEPSVPIKITCPECQGCISLDIEPHAGILTYRCQVGHAYSIKEMIKGKEVQVGIPYGRWWDYSSTSKCCTKSFSMNRQR